MPGHTIRKPLPCSKCGYDLEGLAAKAHCPECGQDVVATLAVRLDPATETLARGNALVRTAWAIYLASAGSVLGCAIALAPMVDHARVSTTPTRWIALLMDGTRTIAPSIALVGALIGLLATIVLLPWNRTRPIVRARLIGGAGFVGWTVLALEPPSFTATLATLGAVAAVAASMTPLLRQLLPHSRLFRTARHATQTTRDLLISAAVSGGAGVLTLVLCKQRGQFTEYAVFSGAVAYSAAMLLVVGLCYRLANAHWVLRSVRRPALRVAEVLGD